MTLWLSDSAVVPNLREEWEVSSSSAAWLAGSNHGEVVLDGQATVCQAGRRT